MELHVRMGSFYADSVEPSTSMIKVSVSLPREAPRGNRRGSESATSLRGELHVEQILVTMLLHSSFLHFLFSRSLRSFKRTPQRILSS